MVCETAAGEQWSERWPRQRAGFYSDIAVGNGPAVGGAFYVFSCWLARVRFADAPRGAELLRSTDPAAVVGYCNRTIERRSTVFVCSDSLSKQYSSIATVASVHVEISARPVRDVRNRSAQLPMDRTLVRRKSLSFSTTYSTLPVSRTRPRYSTVRYQILVECVHACIHCPFAERSSFLAPDPWLTSRSCRQ